MTESESEFAALFTPLNEALDEAIASAGDVCQGYADAMAVLDPVGAIMLPLNRADRLKLSEWLTTEEDAPSEPIGGWTITLILDNSDPDWPDDYIGHKFAGHNQEIDLDPTEVEHLIRRIRSA